jgi:hypothetical protein
MNSVEVAHVLQDPVAQRLFDTEGKAHLAYNGPDGTPRVVPIGFLWNGVAFVMCTATEAPKVRALQEDARVALTVEIDAQPPNLVLVRGEAHVEIVDGVPDEYLAASRKGVPKDQWAEFEKNVRSLYPAMARISVTPRWAKVFDFETRMPIAVERLMAQSTPSARDDVRDREE